MILLKEGQNKTTDNIFQTFKSIILATVFYNTRGVINKVIFHEPLNYVQNSNRSSSWYLMVLNRSIPGQSDWLGHKWWKEKKKTRCDWCFMVILLQSWLMNCSQLLFPVMPHCRYAQAVAFLPYRRLEQVLGHPRTSLFTIKGYIFGWASLQMLPTSDLTRADMLESAFLAVSLYFNWSSQDVSGLIWITWRIYFQGGHREQPACQTTSPPPRMITKKMQRWARPIISNFFWRKLI